MENFIDLDLLLEQIRNTGWLEWIAVSFGVSEVLLAKKNKVWLYPTGIISICCGAIVLVQAKLYAETLLNGYYLAMSIYGWIKWKSRNEFGAPQVTRSSIKDQQVTWAIALGGWAVLYFFLVTFTDSDVPVIDSLVSSTAWAGMWLLAGRKLENWIWLNISNAIAIPLLFYKGLFLFGLLTSFLFVVAILGYLDWRKILKKQDYAFESI
ncbi:nicotinamide riboside transporter PnuC [Algoriphagus vanfongensis]|uniref:nicotinamide riboside transporter PnuC n=1 Tax=Algoriphagus vanfongensis TaxID=426371 RepID=UPI00041B4F5E|nr:nicotinamide riboside transporter PnuC [Algoriphagus vanfongensis]